MRKQSFDFDWRFTQCDESEASTIDYNDTGWRTLNLPHDWSIEGDIHHEHPMGMAGGFFPSGIGWYRKSFEVPAESSQKQIFIYFEGVYMNAEVFINGHSLGIHPYGYTSFSFNLTPYLNFDGENVIAVRVDNSDQLNCRWYTGSGIYRHVWLMQKNPIHIPQWGVAITTPKVSDVAATVQVKTQVENDTEETRAVSVSIALSDASGSTVGSGSTELEVPANEIREVTQSIEVATPGLWCPDEPTLYTAKILFQMLGRFEMNSTNPLGSDQSNIA